MKSKVFQQLFDHGASSGSDEEVRRITFRMLRRKGADFMLLPVDNHLAVRALTLYAPQNVVARLATSFLRLALKFGLPVPLKEVELDIPTSSPLIEFFTDALNLSGLGATNFAIIAGNPKDAARRYVFLLFDTLNRPALVVKVGLGKEGAATVANEARFLEECASEEGLIPEPQGKRLADDLAAFALDYEPGAAPPVYDAESISSCLGSWVRPDRTLKIGDLPIWKRLASACEGVEGFDKLAAAVVHCEVSSLIYHGDFAPWNIKIRPTIDNWVVLDWERGETEGLPGWDWFHYVVQTGVLVEQLDEKNLRAKLIHVMDSKEFSGYASQTGIDGIKMEMALLYILYSIHVLGQTGGRKCLTSLYEHLVEEHATGVGRDRRDFHTFWAARQQGASWLKTNLIYRPGAILAKIGHDHRVPALAFPLLGVLVAAGMSWLVLSNVESRLGVALGLFGSMFVANCLIAAEGLLARATGSVTLVGNIFDRLAGFFSFMVVTGQLTHSSGAEQVQWLPNLWSPWIFVAVITAGASLYSIRIYQDVRGFETGFRSARSNISGLADAVPRMFFFASAWAAGAFWDFLAAYAILLAATACCELISYRTEKSDGTLGRFRRMLLAGHKSIYRQCRRLQFMKVLFAQKRAQMLGFKNRWVRLGVAPVEVPEKIDVVYLWKDESDADWVERRELFLELFGKGSGYNRIDRGSRATKTSLDRLKFSIRSIDKYFDSLGKIFIVSDGQRPAWLKDDHPRVEVIDLNDIFTEASYLPSYNSQAIESYFYNIPNLSEFFVYLNDDFFLNCPVGADDFFTRHGQLRVRLGRAVAARGVPSVNEEGDTSAQKNSNLVLDRSFRKEPRLTVMHRPYAHRKSLLKRASEEFPEEFHLTRRSHFRSIEMLALHSFLVPYWAYYNGEAELVAPQLFRKDMFYWSNDPSHNAEVLERIMETDQISFCIQAELSIQLTEESVESYRQAMERVFPEKSDFEI